MLTEIKSHSRPPSHSSEIMQSAVSLDCPETFHIHMLCSLPSKPLSHANCFKFFFFFLSILEPDGQSCILVLPLISSVTLGRWLNLSELQFPLWFRCYLVKSCPTLCNPMDCSPLGSSVHGILQARILEWVPFPSLGDLSDPAIEPVSPALAGGFFFF